MRIDGKVVLITGASEGIGAASARAFGRRGARLSLTARSLEKLEAVGGSEALVTAGDLTDAEVCRRVVGRTLERYGAIDVLVNNAGVGLYTPAWRAPIPLIRQMFELNFFAALQMTQLVVPHMARQGGGMIVNVGSIAGKVAFPWLTVYCATKYALGALGDGLRMELARDGIRVLTVCPGHVKTGFSSRALEGRPPEKLPRERFAITAEECAEAIARGVERNARTVVVPAVGWILVAVARLLPRLLEARLVRLYQSTERAG
ncbi:MAG: SDR family NAD(P)-dependent oxidoreductase [Acidobacteriota bacterium]